MKGAFFGLTTLDILYESSETLEEDVKISSKQTVLEMGGPATNAARAFAKLGGEAHLISSIGTHPISKLVVEKIEENHIIHHDLTPAKRTPLIFASCVINSEKGSRFVVGEKPQHTISFKAVHPTMEYDIILIDGYYLDAFIEFMKRYCEKFSKKPIIILDGGSYKERLNEVFPLVDIALCSERFSLSHSNDKVMIAQELVKQGVKEVIFTRGAKSMLVYESEENIFAEIAVQKCENVVDTLGAGDLFHGAFCYYFFKNLPRTMKDLEKIAKLSSEFVAKKITTFGMNF